MKTTQWNSGVTVTPNGQKGCSFTFPSPPGHMNSVLQKWGALSQGASVDLTYKITDKSGTPRFLSVDTSLGLRPNFRIMLQRKGDDWTAQNGMEHYRWYPSETQCVFLIQGTGIISFVLRPANFSNVMGQPATSFPKQFNDCLANLDNIQVVFGGGNSFAHGVNVKNGVATFDVSMKVQ